MIGRELYTRDHADRITPGSSYRPSNGSEGEMFMEMWCVQCIHDDYPEGKGCEILARSFLPEDDPDYPKEWVHGNDGQPECTGFCP